jgi:hypothetical protein
MLLNDIITTIMDLIYILMLILYAVFFFYLIFIYFYGRRRKIKILKPLAQALNARLEMTFLGRISLLIPTTDNEARISLMTQTDYLFSRTPVSLRPKIITLIIELEVESSFGLWIQPKGMPFNLEGPEPHFSPESIELGNKEFDEKYQTLTNNRFEAQDFLADEGRMKAADILFDNNFNLIYLGNYTVLAQKADSGPKDVEPNQIQFYVSSLAKFITG